MKTIPQDIIITHILCRLPTKSVGQFRCVSKEWLSLLTDPQFIQTYQKKLNENRFIFESKDAGSLYYSVSYNNHEAVLSAIKSKLPLELDILRIHGSANGLVLASAFKKSLHNSTQVYTVLVLNPTTKDYIEILANSRLQVFGLKGFGYDSVSGDYKVVVFSRGENNDRSVYVYNLRTNTVKLVMSHSPYVDHPWCPYVFVNGFLHWILSTHYRPVIVAFSLADEKLTELPPPNLYREERDMYNKDTKLVALGEKLAIVNGVKGYIWLMNEYGVHESWTKIVLHEFNEIPMVRPEVFYDNGKILFLTRDRLWIYHVEEGTFSESVDTSYMKIKWFKGAYAESLVSPPKFSTSMEDKCEVQECLL